MKKTLSCIMVLAMFLSLLPVLPAAADVADPALTKHTHSDTHVCGEKCPGGVTWTAWSNGSKLPADSGHYYLTADVQLSETQEIAAGKDITICLNGYNIKAASTARAAAVSGKLTVADCTAYEQEDTYISGSVVGAACADGAIFSVRRGGTLVLESGKLTGGKTTETAGGGAVFLQKGTSAGAGGAMYMYGGEISGNEGYNGGAICVGGAESGCTPAAFHMYGGEITGNTARNNGGGIYLDTRSVAEISGGQITGNTAKKAASVLVYGAYAQLTVSGATRLDGVEYTSADNGGLKVNGLTEGSQIKLTTMATELEKIVSVAEGGKQKSWSAHWITANGESVSLVEGVFVSGHYHDGVKYTAFDGGTSHNTLPSTAGSYYLSADILRNTNGGTVNISASTTQHLCLNGHTITHRNPSGRLYNIQGKFFLEDCTAYTDDSGKYISGGITYAGSKASTMTYGMCFSVQRGCTFTMTGGQLYGWESSVASSSDGSVIYIQGANTSARAIFNMEGGEIHSNTGKAQGIAIRMVKASSNAATKNFSQINISGGKIWGNSTTGTAAVGATGDEINLTGGIITDNEGKYGGLYSAAAVKLNISGNTVIDGNSPGNLYLAGSAIINIGEMGQDARIGITAATVDRAVSAAVASDPRAYFYSDDETQHLSLFESCLYLGEEKVELTHFHNVDGSAGETGWMAWTETTKLPSAAGNYYLENDIQLSADVGLSANVNICLNGKTVTGKDGKRVAAIGNGYTLTITDCCTECGTITGAESEYGGVFNVQRGGTLKLYNGKLSGNEATNGIVHLQAPSATEPGGKFYMYGGEISGNQVTRGGAVCLSGATSSQAQNLFAMYGGTITGNTASYGGAVYAYANAEVELHGGSITGNTAKSLGGAMYLAKGSKLTVAGAPVVKNNTAASMVHNIYLKSDLELTVGDMTQGAEVCISAETGERFLSGKLADTADAAYFHSDSVYRMIELKEERLYLGTSDSHSHCTCATLVGGCDHEKVRWQAWEMTDSLPASSGYYYLINDITLKERWNVTANKDVHLCLNGKTVTAPENGRHIQVQATAKLSISDCVGTGTLTGGNSTYGGSVSVTRRAEFTLYGGNITGNTAPTSTGEGLGGAIYVQAGKGSENGGIVNMYGGRLSDNTAYNGAAIMLAIGEDASAAPATANIYGGEITNNYSAGLEKVDANGNTSRVGGCGAAVYAGKYSALNMEGGLIAGNRGENYGSVLYFNGSQGKFSGGTITENISRRNGGAIYATSGSVVEITGTVVISKNQVISGYGGGIATSKSTLKMSGGTVTENKVNNGGSGLYVEESTFEMTGGVVSKHDCPNYGGGIYLRNSTGKMSGGKVTQNKSYKDGTGIHVYDGTFELTGDAELSYNVCDKGVGAGLSLTKTAEGKISGGRIVGNEASTGAGVYVQNKAHLMMTGGYIGANTTRTGSGCAIYSNKCNIDLYGGTIGDNYTKKNGAVFVNDATVRMGGIRFANNESKGSGAGFYLTRCTVSMDGTRIENNKVGGVGGGFYLHTCKIEIKNILVKGNSTTKDIAGGAYFYKCEGTIDKSTISENVSKYVGGGVYIVRYCDIIMNECLVEKNSSVQTGGGVLVSSWSKATLNNCTLRENVSSSGGGLHALSTSTVIMNGGLVTENQATSRIAASGNPIGGHAGGIYMQTNTGTQTGQCEMYLNGVTIENNWAKQNGGGIHVHQQMIMHIDGCTIQNNYAEVSGGGVYQNTGTYLTIKNTKILANECNKTGSGIYAGSDFEIEDSIVTGNKTAEGAAVYIPPARYDGHSYANGALKFGGDLQIFGNKGTMDDLYMDEGTAAGVSLQGFGENTNIKVQLHSGILTNTILGAYNYEGGDLHYTITYGDRSLTDPEYEAPTTAQTQQEEQKTEGGNALLYVGVGIFALAVIGAVVLLILKKKKSAPAEKN